MYKFTYKKPCNLLWKTEEVIGHNLDKEQNKMCLYYQDGGIREISKWNECEVKLGIDWVLAIKKQMEKSTGNTLIMDT